MKGLNNVTFKPFNYYTILPSPFRVYKSPSQSSPEVTIMPENLPPDAGSSLPTAPTTPSKLVA